MADQIEVKMVGTEIAKKDIKKWTKEKTEEVKAILLKTGFKVETSAKEMAPVLTGRLRGSISVNWSGSGLGEGKVKNPAKKGDGVDEPPGPKGLVVAVGSNVKYARRREHGFVGKDKLGRRYNESGKPYLYPAFFMHEGDIEKALKKEFKKK